MNNKINLLPNKKYTNNSQTFDSTNEKHKKVRKEIFSMHIPDEEEELNDIEENNKSDLGQKNKTEEEKTIENKDGGDYELNNSTTNNKSDLSQEGEVKPKKDKVATQDNQSIYKNDKKTFWNKFKNIFKKK